MRVIIVEDNPMEMSYLKEILSREQDIDIVGEACDGKEAMNKISKLRPDVAFIDISMPEVSGMDLAKKLDGKVFVVFVTAHSHLALEAFKVGSIDYLLKPVEPERLKQTLKRINKLLPKRVEGLKKISISIKGTIISIDINEIIFIEKVPLSKKIAINIENKEFIVSGNLDSYEEKLKDYGFIRSHKSFIININKIYKMLPWGDKSYLAKLYGTKKEVLISRSYAPMVKSMIL